MGLQVLIVDDSSTTRLVIQRIIRLTDPEIGACHQAANGREALAILAQQQIDCVFADLHMPEMDGRDLLRAIRANEQWKNLPVAIITSEVSDATGIELVQLGATCYRKKPLTPEAVRGIFESMREKTT
jgi:two-component system, chemotaxis family, chemotaxis protein CheY